MHKYEKIGYLLLLSGLLIGGIGYLFTIEFYDIAQFLAAFGMILFVVGGFIFAFSKAKMRYKLGLLVGCYILVNSMVVYRWVDEFILHTYTKNHHADLEEIEKLLAAHPEIDRISFYTSFSAKSEYKTDDLLSASKKEEIFELMEELQLKRFRQFSYGNQGFEYTKNGVLETYISEQMDEDSSTTAKLYELDALLYENTKGKNCEVYLKYGTEFCIECTISDYYKDQPVFRGRLITLLRRARVRTVIRQKDAIKYQLVGFYRLYRKLNAEQKIGSIYKFYNYPVGYGYEAKLRNRWF